jgi:hypothetical protein
MAATKQKLKERNAPKKDGEAEPDFVFTALTTKIRCRRPGSSV